MAENRRIFALPDGSFHSAQHAHSVRDLALWCSVSSGEWFVFRKLVVSASKTPSPYGDEELFMRYDAEYSLAETTRFVNTLASHLWPVHKQRP